MKTSTTTIIDHFSTLSDPRIELKTQHKLEDIVVITICGVICGADTWDGIANYGNAKYDWFKGFLELRNGIPSHDTFNRVFSHISPLEFQKCFISWINAVTEITNGQVIAIDGKTVRRSIDRAFGKAAIHMVSAWASANRVVLGQVKTEEKSNEITAIPELLKLLEISGSIITIDAMGCQKAIAEQIVSQGGDYIFSLKGNQGNLHKEVEEFFTDADKNSYKGLNIDYYETTDVGHGRKEVRRYWTTDILDEISNKDNWAGLKIVGMMESERHVNGEVTIDHSYYISSIKNDAERFGKSVRSHWGIENSLHWVLDIAFREDDCRKRTGHSAENFSLIRHIALNLLRHEKTLKNGIKEKRLKAGWDNNYLLKVLGF